MSAIVKYEGTNESAGALACGCHHKCKCRHKHHCGPTGPTGPMRAAGVFPTDTNVITGPLLMSITYNTGGFGSFLPPFQLSFPVRGEYSINYQLTYSLNPAVVTNPSTLFANSILSGQGYWLANNEQVITSTASNTSTVNSLIVTLTISNIARILDVNTDFWSLEITRPPSGASFYGPNPGLFSILLRKAE